MVDLKKKENENEEQFIWRLGQEKDSGILDMDWEEIADVINKECRDDDSEYRNESAYRKPYQQAKRFYEAGVFSKYDDDAYIQELRDAKHEIRKEKQKMFDERTALNRELREQGRRESMFDIMKRAIDEYKPLKFNYVPNIIPDSDNDFIIHLTDVHCGMEIDSVFNKFNIEILSDRLRNYLNEIKELTAIFHPENAYVILGGDMIHGLIHVNARIEAKENIANQIMIVADLVSNFINELRQMFKYVEIHTTAGNHSRVTANKEENTHGDNLDLLVPYACKKDFKNIDNVNFVDNYLDYDVATFKVRGHMIYAAHGDKDSVKSVVYNMIKFARKANLQLPDMCYLGHRHTNGLTTVDDVKVIESGSVGGMDTYCIDKRLIGTPEQTITVVTERKMIKALCDIQID